jgi:hypothetical protein
MYDTLDAFSTDFSTNGDVDGWDLYNNIYLYGCWNNTVFGTSYDTSCYIGRSNNFQYVEAEDYYHVKVMMKITANGATPPTTGRIMWTRLGDSNWNSDKQTDFALIADDKWNLYTINLGPEQWWQGNISNLRFYPFIDGRDGDQFAIRFIRIGSLTQYKCANTQCSYYTFYEHPCPGAGDRASVEAGESKSLYTIAKDVSDELIVNIDDYGDCKFVLDSGANMTGVETARVVSNAISSMSIGGYNYCTVEYSENDKIKITSGSTGSDSSISLSDSAAARELGFYDSDGVDLSDYSTGSEPATGFDYASSRMLGAYELNKLIDGNSTEFAYIHNPDQYSVEGGRRDFHEVGTGQLTSDLSAGDYYESLNNISKTLIDLSHPFNNNGRITAIYMYGKITSAAKVKILRPHKDGTYTVVDTVSMPSEDGSYLYTTNPIVYRVDCDVLIKKGDVLGIYNANVYVGVNLSDNPDATFFQVTGEATGTIDPDYIYSYGLAGLALYARGDRWQTNTILDIDLGSRINIEEVNIHGEEESGYFEYNIACCEDVSWQTDFFGKSHYHAGTRWTDGTPFYDIHLNIGYGHASLNDCIRTADNGQQGDTYADTANGMSTTGDHAYFYCDGDGEWLYSNVCTGKTEYCWPYVPYGIGGFKYDPIAFYLHFPYNFKANVHKSIIYFKERNNFRNLALSYYRGDYDAFGNADDSHYTYIPSYTSIKLDGLEFLPDDDTIQSDYVFNNPMDAKPIYLSGVCTNWEEYRGASATDWVILEHNFDPVECYGFRFYTNFHNSTKITEMELYSRMPTDPSLLDNVILTYSSEGIVWNTASMVDRVDYVSAFLGGAPRYITLELASPTTFFVNELDASVGDQLKTADCEDNILLDEARSGQTNEATQIVLENKYDKAFDLIVDLPKETHENDNIVFWSKIGSQAEIDTPEIGPPCTLHKNSDREILNDNEQCAINVPGYVLKNLVHNKEAYYSYDDERWTSWGTISSGTSIDFDNTYTPYNYRDTHITEFSFTPYSAKYWKINTVATSDPVLVRDIQAYFEGSPVTIEKVYGLVPDGITSMGSQYTTSDGSVIRPTYGDVILHDDFEDGVFDTTQWELTQRYGGGASFVEEDGWLKPDNYGAKGAGNTHGPTLSGVNAPSTSDVFGFEYTFHASGNESGGMMHYDVFMRDYSDTIVYQVHLTDSWASSSVWQLYVYEYGGQIAVATGLASYRTLDPDRPEKVRCIKYNNRLYVWFNGVFIVDVATTASVPIKCIEFTPGRQWNYSPYTNQWLGEVFVWWPPYLDTAFGFELPSTDPVDTIKLIHDDQTLTDATVYTSSTNTNDYTPIAMWGDLDFTYENADHFTRFAIDLENRHDIDIIRNYGSATNKLFINTSSYVTYSNSDISNVENVVWDNSDEDDARWLRIDLPNDDSTHAIRKLGIYPDTGTAYRPGGGYNCDWEPIETRLTDYTPSVNVAYDATVSGNNHFLFLYPINAVDGDHSTYSLDACWGFEIEDGVNPYIDIEFDQPYWINLAKLYHGYDPGDSTYINTDYKLYYLPTASGSSWTQIFSETSNSDHEAIYQFTPVYTDKVRLEVSDYDTERITVVDPDTGIYYQFEGGLIREIEIYTYVETGYIDSETWPIVAINLRDQFQAVGHDVVNKDITDSATDWYNTESLFRYSDNQWNDVEKVDFYRAGSEVEVYLTSDSTGNARGSLEYIFDTDIYIDAGRHNLEWQSYYATDGTVSIRLEGPGVVEHVSENGTTGWADESVSIVVPTSGYYTIKAVQNETAENNWGARNVYIYRTAGFSKWVSVRCDTAENYSWDNDASKFGERYLSLLKVYGDDVKYRYPRPTEYYWWWTSTVSTLDNSGFYTVVGDRSLAISYPSSTEADTVAFIEGDDFGVDTDFSSQDYLKFYLYVSDVNNLDTQYGDFTFGSINEAEQKYYMWDLENISLSDGWNTVRLKFEDYDYTYPESEYRGQQLFLDNLLDFSTVDTKSLRFRYRGTASGTLQMYLDGFEIERNRFDDDVKFGKGLCLVGNEYLLIPLADISLEKGTVEMWLKPYYDSYGRDLYENMLSRVLFTIVNNNNDILSFGIKSGNWFEVNSGHVREELIATSATENELPVGSFTNRNEVMHLAVVWSNDGKFTDNKDTIRFYLNNELVYWTNTPWDVEDTKSAVIKLGGGNTQLALNQDTFGGGVFENVKIYNYCKTDFNISSEGIDKDITYTPNEFVEISSDNINFYGVGSDQLPITFQQVPTGSSRTIYVRSNKNDNFKQSKKTANLVVGWLTTV